MPKEITNQEIIDFAKTLPGRIIKKPTISFAEWLVQMNIDFKPLTEAEEAQAIGSMVFPTQNRTGHQRGKERTAQARFFEHNKLMAQYYEEVPRKDIITPLDLTRECDRAYVRVRIKRIKQKNN